MSQVCDMMWTILCAIACHLVLDPCLHRPYFMVRRVPSKRQKVGRLCKYFSNKICCLYITIKISYDANLFVAVSDATHHDGNGKFWASAGRKAVLQPSVCIFDLARSPSNSVLMYTMQRIHCRLLDVQRDALRIYKHTTRAMGPCLYQHQAWHAASIDLSVICGYANFTTSFQSFGKQWTAQERVKPHDLTAHIAIQDE